MTKIVIYSLNGCGHSRAAVETLKRNNIKYELFNVDWDDKEDYKRSNNMQTFPQIFFENKNSSRIKIGGNSDLNNILDLVKKTKKNKKFDIMLNSIKNNLSIDKRTSLELIHFLV